MSNIRIFLPEQPSGFMPGPYHGDPISAPKAGTPNFPAPTKIYMLYFSLTATSSWIIKHLRGDVTGTIEASEEALFDIASNGPPYDPTLENGFNHTTVWNEPTYFTMVMDKAGYDFYWRPSDGIEPITFLPRKMIDPKKYDKNYAFYDLQRVTVKNVPAVRLVNYLTKDSNGAPLEPDENRIYCMQYNILAPLVAPGLPPPLIWDPDSQNQGPD